MLPTIRPASPADFHLLDELERACPMAGHTSWFISRQGDYTRVLRFFDKAYIWVAEANNRFAGSISWSWHTVLVNGSEERIGWLADVRIHPDFQKTSLIYRLLREAYEQGCADGVDLTIGTTLEGNRDIEMLATGRARFPSFKHVATFDMLQLYPGLPVSIRLNGLELRPANQNDLPTICELLNSYYEEFQFRIEATPEKLLQVLSLAEGMRLEDYTLASRNSQTVAVIHTWDQDSFKKPIVTAYSPYLGLITRVTRLLGRFSPLPGLPKPGGVLRYLWLRDLACRPGCEADLKSLIRWQYKRVKGSPYHFVMGAVQQGDPLNHLYHGIFRTRVTLKMWALSLSGRNVQQELAQSGSQLYHDFTLT